MPNSVESSNASSPISRSGFSTPSKTFSSCYFSPASSPFSRRRIFRMEDTKARLFGPPDVVPRKKIDHMKSNIFSNELPTMNPPKRFNSKCPVFVILAYHLLFFLSLANR
jgi:hypothetical protein